MSTMRSYPTTVTVPGTTQGQTGGEPVRLRDIVLAVIEQVMVWHERARQRRQLQNMSDHMLRDIGLGRGDVYAETSKPFWRA